MAAKLFVAHWRKAIRIIMQGRHFEVLLLLLLLQPSSCTTLSPSILDANLVLGLMACIDAEGGDFSITILSRGEAGGDIGGELDKATSLRNAHSSSSSSWTG